MDRKDFYNRLSRGALPSVLLFEGEEDYLKQTALNDLCRAMLSTKLVGRQRITP